MCLPVPSYDRGAQARAADELDQLPPGAVLRRMVEDYGELRARARTLCGASAARPYRAADAGLDRSLETRAPA